jgi:putative endonuclease
VGLTPRAGSSPAFGTKNILNTKRIFALLTVYAIKSKIKDFTYVGFTSNLVKRLYYHNNGFEKSTKPYSPFNLIYSEIVETRKAARIRKKFLKSGKGREFLKLSCQQAGE